MATYYATASKVKGDIVGMGAHLDEDISARTAALRDRDDVKVQCRGRERALVRARE